MTELISYLKDSELKQISDKVAAGIRISREEGLILFGGDDEASKERAAGRAPTSTESE